VEKTKDPSFKVSWGLTIIPVALVILLSVAITLTPGSFDNALTILQGIFINDLGSSYIIFNLVCLGIAIYVAFSKYGNIKLGDIDKPRYKTLTWIGMIFTSTMAADMLYWAMIEWIYYYQSDCFGIAASARTVAQTQDIISSYPLFHWGVMSWIYFILPGAIVGFMMFVKKRPNETISEACRPVLGKHVDGFAGKFIDMLCLLSCTLSLPIFIRIGTPVITSLCANVFGVPDNGMTNAVIIIIIAAIYTAATVIGMKAIQLVSDVTMVLYIVLIAMFLVFGPVRYIVETAVTSIGFVVQHYPTMATWLDPLRLTASEPGGAGFPQSWTVYFNANWLVNMCSVPFFIAKISEGRTMKKTILGGLAGGVGATYCSFIVFGNYSIFRQMSGIADYAKMAANGATESQIITEIIKTLPMAGIVMVLFIITMIGLFATTFDANSLILAGFCQRNRKLGQEPSKGMRLFWALLIAIIPIAMSFAGTSLSQLKIIMVIAAYPMMILLIIMLVGFFRDLKKVDMDKYDPKVGIDPAIFDDEFLEIPETAGKIKQQEE